MWMIFLVLLVFSLPLSVQAEEQGLHKTFPDMLLQPMNRPMDELGVPGRNTTLCSDRWYTCSSYDRQQLDQKYIGVPLKELLRYGEPSWPGGERQGRESTGSHESLDLQDHLDKD